MKVNLTNSARRDRTDWHYHLIRDSVDQFLIEHDIKETSNIKHALLTPDNTHIVAQWLNSKGFAVTAWRFELGSDTKAFGLEFDEANEYYIEAKLKHV